MLRKTQSVTIVATLLAAATLVATTAHADEWRHTVFVYGMGAALDGTAQVGPLEVPVDLSMSDVFDALELGAMAAYRIENETWSVTGDTTYMGLGGHSRTEGGRVKGDVDVDQFTLMGTVGRRLSERFELLFSLSYFNLSTDLQVDTTAPVSGEVTTRTASVDVDWIDPMIGAHFELPFHEDWKLNLRGDIGGFGVGSNFSYQALVTLQWQSGGSVGAVFGYRLIGFDYEDDGGGSSHYERFDLTEQGPLVGMTYRF